MVFDSNEIENVKKQENLLLNSIINSDLFYLISKECKKRKFYILATIEIDNITKYHSSINIAIRDENGFLIKESEEPNCSLFIYETICYSKNNKIQFIDLLSDDGFLIQLKKLLGEIISYNK